LPKNGISFEGITIFLEKISAKTPNPKLFRSIPGSRRLMRDGTKIYAFGLVWVEIGPVSRKWLPIGMTTSFYYA
jgi:hypothetical protein